MKAQLKDHQIGELKNKLRDCCKKYGHTQQLRSRIGTVLSEYIESFDNTHRSGDNTHPKYAPGKVLVSTSNPEHLENKELMQSCYAVIKNHNKARQKPIQ